LSVIVISCYLFGQCLEPWRWRGCIMLQQTYKQSQVYFNRKTTTHIDQLTLQLHYPRSNVASIASDIAYWPATPRMKWMRPAIAERFDNPDQGCQLELLRVAPLNFTVLFGSQNSWNKWHANIKGCTVHQPNFWVRWNFLFDLMILMFMPSMLWRCWLGGRKGIQPVKKTKWWVAGVICLERGADLHMAQLRPLPLTVSCFNKIQSGFTFLVPAHLGSPRKGSLNGCVCALNMW